MRKDSKESVWPFYQPASFRHWTKRKMNPVPVQTAVKTKKRLALCYLISTAVMLHYCIFAYGTKKHIPTVENNLDPGMYFYYFKRPCSVFIFVEILFRI